jgi:hypothetical protein
MCTVQPPYTEYFFVTQHADKSVERNSGFFRSEQEALVYADELNSDYNGTTAVMIRNPNSPRPDHYIIIDTV